jgi:glucan 1,3-beta-glucosidase
MGAFGITFAGEFSNAINDCGLYVNGVGLGARFDGTFPGFTGKGVGNCDDWTKWQTWDQPTKDGLKLFALASMDALTVRSSA